MTSMTPAERAAWDATRDQRSWQYVRRGVAAAAPVIEAEALHRVADRCSDTPIGQSLARTIREVPDVAIGRRADIRAALLDVEWLVEQYRVWCVRQGAVESIHRVDAIAAGLRRVEGATR